MLPQNNPDRIRIVFDDHRLLANAGLLLPATLARHLVSRAPTSCTTGALHRWATGIAPHTLGPENTPAITEYADTTFRSQLEVRWAAYFDQRGIAWQYEPVRLSGWTPDFRLVLNGVEAYAEVKPVSEFPMDVAQRMLGAGRPDDILILGGEPRHAWRQWGDKWTPVDLAA